MKVLMTGDIVGSPGRTVFARGVAEYRRTGKTDFVVANGENAAGGKGITERMAEDLFNAGADVVTLGDHTWDQKETGPLLEKEHRLVRPANFAPGCAGRGHVTVRCGENDVTVINLVGRVFMSPYDCPFRKVDEILRDRDIAKIVLVDFHAEATSEKSAMAHYLDGRVTAVVGSHTHVQTADEQILSGGTAFISDMGLTGPTNSIIGCSVESVMPAFITGMRGRFQVSKDVESARMQGVLITVDPDSGKAKKIKRVSES